MPSDNPQQEDCLFLDVIVPGVVFRNNTLPSLPVVVWIHGGGYSTSSYTLFDDIAEGSKDLYDGTGLVTLSGNTIVYVAINYRVHLNIIGYELTIAGCIRVSCWARRCKCWRVPKCWFL